MSNKNRQSQKEEEKKLADISYDSDHDKDANL